jgi:hypothetical protein
MGQGLRAVICALNSQYVHSSLAPWCLLAGVEAYCVGGIAAEVVEGTVNEDLGEVLSRILEHKPGVVGFSCYIWNIGKTKKLVRLVKRELPEALIILGGPEVSFNAAEILRDEPLVDYVISGEGERPFALLLNAICRGESAQGIPGVSLRTGEEAYATPPHVSEEDPPSPYSERYLAALDGRIAYLETSRGCPFSCAFCLSGGSGNLRFFDMERAKNEMLLLANSGAHTVKLVDRTFNSNRKRAAELFDFIIRNHGIKFPEGVCFHFEIGGDLLDTETIDLLKSAPAGLIQFEIGIQSFNEDTLAAVSRKTDIKRLKSNIKRLTERGNIHVHIDLIAGLPFEGLNSFIESFNAAYELGANMLQLGFLKLLRGSPMHRSRKDYPGVFSESAPYEVRETPWLSAQDLDFLHRTEQVLNRLYNSGRFRRTLAYILDSTAATPFELFSAFAEHLGERGTAGISLNKLNALVFEYFAKKPGIDRMTLRDTLVCDNLATNRSGQVPPVLKVEDPMLKRMKKRLGQAPGRRGVAILYSEPCVVYADYKAKNPVTGEYPLTKIPLGDCRT